MILVYLVAACISIDVEILIVHFFLNQSKYWSLNLSRFDAFDSFSWVLFIVLASYKKHFNSKLQFKQFF